MNAIEQAIAKLTFGEGDYVVIREGGPRHKRWVVIQWINAGDDEIHGGEGTADNILTALKQAARGKPI